MASGRAITGLVLNIFFPGVGSLIGGHAGAGIVQLILWILSIIIMTVGTFLAGLGGAALGYIVYLVAWIWALITGIQMVKSS